MKDFFKKNKNKNKSQVSQDRIEAQESQSGPALFCNRFYVNTGDVVRISFMEKPSFEESSNFRTAVAMSISDAVSLKQLLENLLEQCGAIAPKEEAKIDTPSEACSESMEKND